MRIILRPLGLLLFVSIGVELIAAGCAEGEADTVGDSDSDSDSDSDADGDAGAGSDSGTDTDTDTDSDGDTDSDIDAGADAGGDSGSDSDTDTDTGSDSETGGGTCAISVSESFEGGVPTAFTEGTTGGADWLFATTMSHPSGASTPTDGSYMAQFNSWSASSGSTADLTTAAIDFSCAAAVTMTFDMYHDTFYDSSYTELLQMQISTDGGTVWSNAGSAFNRYDGTDAWKAESLDLTAQLAGRASGMVRIHGVSDYGDDIYIDHVAIIGE
jgi:hypothetical protein